MHWLIKLLIAVCPTTAFAATFSPATFECDYAYLGAPFVKVAVEFNSDGQLSPSAKITHYGKTTYESATLETPLSGERYRITISKESPENWLTVIIYPDLSSKFINPHVPFGKEMTGACAKVLVD